MSSLLAGARLVLRSGLYSLPRCHVQLSPGPVRYLLNSPRFCAIAVQQKGSTNNEPAPVAIQLKQTQQFDWALTKLDSSVRRTGRISKTLLLKVFHDICRMGHPSSNQALLLLRSCGSLLPELQVTERTEIAHQIWHKLQKMGSVFDVSHYNALLKVYLQNEHKFSPTEFLAEMERANVQPNRVTYQRLIAAYCNEGDIEGASKILGFMKEKGLPITEAVFNNLVTGNARAGDLESAKNILNVMQGTGIEPSPDTHVALLAAYAEKGDIENIKQTLTDVSQKEEYLSDRDLMQVIWSLAKAGFPQYVQDILDQMRSNRVYRADAMNLCLRLLTEGYEDTAFQVLMAFFSSPSDQNGDPNHQGTFFLRHCVNLDLPIDKLKQFCDGLRESNMHSSPLQFTLMCVLESRKRGPALELMKIMKEEGLPVRPHYCWPLLVHYQKEKNVQATIEVLKALKDIGVELDMETLSNYIVGVFENVHEAYKVLKENGYDFDSSWMSVLELRSEASTGNLNKVFAILSSPDCPSIDIAQFRGSLFSGFRRFDNIKLMAMITQLLYKDSRYYQASSGSTEAVGQFLYNLIDSMSESEVQAKEDHLRQYFHQLKKMDVAISANVYRGIRNILDAYEVPSLIKDVVILVKSQGDLSSSYSGQSENDFSTLEKKIEALEAENKPFEDVLAVLIGKLCLQENLEKALEVKAKYNPENMTAGMYANLISLCCQHNNPEEALRLKQELDIKLPSTVLNLRKYQALVEVLSKNGLIADAINVLKEMKAKDVLKKSTMAVSFFHALNASAIRGDAEAVKQLFESIVMLDLAKPTTNLCSPLVSVHFVKGDLSQALEVMLDCSSKYQCMPLLHDILCKTVENGDTELLQKAMDHVSRERGEMSMLYSLFFAFLQTGKNKEAKKIMETPGMRARPGRLEWFAKRCIALNKMDVLENFVEVTQKLFECDRDEMYFYLLELCMDNNDWKKADAVWTEMQEENVIPRERTLKLLADIFKCNGKDVPFDVPEVWHKTQADTVSQSWSSTPESSFERRVLVLSKKHRGKDAYNVFLEAGKKSVQLSSVAHINLMKALLSEGFLEEAEEVKTSAKNHIKDFTLNDVVSSLFIITQVRRDYLKDAINSLKTMLENDKMPSQLAVTRLLQGLAAKGDVETIEEVEKMLANLTPVLSLSPMIFTRNKVMAHFSNNNIEEGISLIEPLYMVADSAEVPSISYVIKKAINDNMEEAVEKLSAMAERLANHFSVYQPVTEIFLHYVFKKRKEDARHLLQRCSAIPEQTTSLIAFIVRVSQTPEQADVITDLLELIPDFTKKDVAYSYLMKCYATSKNVDAASALYETMKTENMNPDELLLKRFAGLLTSAGKPVPFTEPPETFKFYAEKLKREHIGVEDDAH